MTDLYSQKVLKYLGLAHLELHHYFESTFTQSVFELETLYKANLYTRKPNVFEDVEKECVELLSNLVFPPLLETDINKSVDFLNKLDSLYGRMPSNNNLKYINQICNIADEVTNFYNMKLAEAFQKMKLDIKGVKFEKQFDFETIAYILKNEDYYSGKFSRKFSELIFENKKINQLVLDLKKHVRIKHISPKTFSLDTSFQLLFEDLKRHLTSNKPAWGFKDALNHKYHSQNIDFYFKIKEYSNIFQFEFLTFPFITYDEYYFDKLKIPQNSPTPIKEYLETTFPLHKSTFSAAPFRFIYSTHFLISTNLEIQNEGHFLLQHYNPSWNFITNGDFNIINLIVKKLIYLDLYFEEAISRTHQYANLSIEELLAKYYEIVNSNENGIIIFWGIQIPRHIGKIFIECFIALLEYRQNSKESWFKQHNKEYLVFTNKNKKEYSWNDSYDIKEENISKSQNDKEEEKFKPTSADLEKKEYYYPYKLYWDSKKNGDLKTIFYELNKAKYIHKGKRYMELVDIDTLLDRIFTESNEDVPINQNQISLPYNSHIGTIRSFLVSFRAMYYKSTPEEKFAQLLRDNFHNHYGNKKYNFDLTYNSLEKIASNMHQGAKIQILPPARGIIKK